LKVSGCLVKEKKVKNVPLAFLKTLTNSKDCSEIQLEYLFRLSFGVVGRFSSLHGTPNFRNNFSMTGGFRNNF
jgi:hypothetical protein